MSFDNPAPMRCGVIHILGFVGENLDEIPVEHFVDDNARANEKRTNGVSKPHHVAALCHQKYNEIRSTDARILSQGHIPETSTRLRAATGLVPFTILWSNND